MPILLITVMSRREIRYPTRAKVSKIISDAADDIERILKDESISFESAEGQFKSIVDDAKIEIDKFKTTEQRENGRAKVEYFTTWVNALDATEEGFTADVIKARELYNELTADQKEHGCRRDDSEA